MCGIFGWMGLVSNRDKQYLLDRGTERGRDGWGIWYDGIIKRSLEGKPELDVELSEAYRVLGNFRATPTTEVESSLSLLQPYEGIVHNGTIANDKDFGDFPIDSMTLPLIIKNREFDYLIPQLQKIKGSYAIAYYHRDDLILACNYKPIYFYRDGYSFMFASTPSMLPNFSVPIPPYSVARLNAATFDLEIREIPRRQNKKVLLAASAGLDSTTVAYMLKAEGYQVTLIHLTYGCLAEGREVERIHRIADEGGFDLKLIDMPRGVMRGTITEGDYHKDGISGTEYANDWVSARNLLMLSIMTAYAETNDYGYIAFGGNNEESMAFPDNEQEFGRKFNEILPYSVQNGIKIELLQPLATYMKHEIVKIGHELNVPYELTWSCYSDGDRHCDNCGPCSMRKIAFKRNGLKDPVFE